MYSNLWIAVRDGLDPSMGFCLCIEEPLTWERATLETRSHIQNT